MYDRTIVLAVLIVALLTPIYQFEKKAVSSHHWGGTGKYLFTENNPGTGAGIAFGTIAFSHVTYIDSFSCAARNLQARVTTPPVAGISVGVALNIAIKCWNPDMIPQVLVVPTFVYKDEYTVKDIVPRIPFINKIGVISTSEEQLRRPM